MASSPTDAFLNVQSLPGIMGPASISGTLLDGVSTANFEGLWVPWGYAKGSWSLEVSGLGGATLSSQLYTTNVVSPLNSYTVTLGGSVTVGDTLTLTFQFPGQTPTAAYTTITSDTLTLAAAGLVLAINGSPALQAMGVRATSAAAVITVTWPSFVSIGGSQQNYVAPFLLITGLASGSATETFTVATTTGGNTLGSAITSASMVAQTTPARWIKLRVTTLTGGTPTITAIAQGSA